jgi:ESS family glutamate:Na+ symporter
MLLLGLFLRAKIKFLQNMMVPASLTGGFIGFALVSMGWLTYPGPAGEWITIKSGDFLPFIFHAFNISFISLCLTRSVNPVPTSKIFKGGMWLSLNWSISLTLQALVGAATVWVYNLVTRSDVNIFLGYLVTHGFTQGPGQAFAMGAAWSKGFNIPDAVNLGLIWATMGYIAAVVVGVPMARAAVKKGLNENKRAKLDDEFLTGLLKQDTKVVGGYETTHSSNVDTLAYHLALVGVVYLITYIEITITSRFIKHMLFSYPLFFFHGLCWAVVVRKVCEGLGIGRLMDPGIQKRITGLSVDYLLVSSIMGISFVVLTKYLGVVIAVSITVSAATYFMVQFFRKRLSELAAERAIAIYGCNTGSTANGLLLLRIMDPDFSTSVGMELAFFNVAILFTTLPILAIMAPELPGYSQPVIVGAYVLYTILCVVAVKLLGMWSKPQKP